MAEHSTLTGANLHEPKGVENASAGQVYVANGAGSGTWTAPGSWTELETAHAAFTGSAVHEPKGIDTATAQQTYVADGSGSGTWTDQKVYLYLAIADIGTAGDTYIVSPVSGNITKIYCVLQGAATGSVTNITPYIAGIAVTGGAVAIASNASAGDIETADPSANNAITAGAAIRFNTDGGSASTTPVIFTIEVTLT